MINEIEISNFRPHDKIKLKDLHPNLNVIIGDTGTGKTSIFRALRLLFNNEPTGGAKLYKFKEKAELFIKAIANEHNISRKAKSYTIDKHKLTAFGKKVPEPVKEIISLQDINWQLQIQPHFLILDNGGTVAKYLNPIMGSEESDLIIEKIKEQASKLRTEFKVFNLILNDNKKIVNRLQNIGEYKKRLNEIQNHVYLLQADERKISDLTIKTLQVTELNSKIVNPEKIKSFIERIGEIESLIVKRNNKFPEIQAIDNKLAQLKNIGNIYSHDSIELYIKTIEEIETKQIEKNTLQTRVDKLQSFLLSWKINDEELKEGLEKQKKLQSEWDEKFSTLKYCLLCGNIIKHTKLGISNAKDHIHK